MVETTPSRDEGGVEHDDNWPTPQRGTPIRSIGNGAGLRIDHIFDSRISLRWGIVQFD